MQRKRRGDLYAPPPRTSPESPPDRVLTRGDEEEKRGADEQGQEEGFILSLVSHSAPNLRQEQE